MLGLWTSGHPLAWVATGLAGTGVIWAAVYMLWMLQRVVFGRIRHPENAHLSDLNAREFALLAPLLFLMLFMGVYPRPFLDRSRDGVAAVRARLAAPSGEISVPVEARNSAEGSR
jgi:NADH-quinone oxidoreductase subunit M